MILSLLYLGVILCDLCYNIAFPNMQQFGRTIPTIGNSGEEFNVDDSF